MELDADDLVIEALAQLRNQLLLGQTTRPLVERLQRHEEFDKKGTIRIGAVLTATLLRKHRPHGIVAPDDVANARNGLYTAVQCDRRRHHPADPKVALFQLRQKLCAEPAAKQSAHCKKRNRDRG